MFKTRARLSRTEFSEDDSKHLVQYIAVENPGLTNRTGNRLYQNLVDNEKKWPWSGRHTWQSWREHYKKNQDRFDVYIKKYQKKSGIDAINEKYRKANLFRGGDEESEDEDKKKNDRQVKQKREESKKTKKGKEREHAGPVQESEDDEGRVSESNHDRKAKRRSEISSADKDKHRKQVEVKKNKGKKKDVLVIDDVSSDGDQNATDDRQGPEERNSNEASEQLERVSEIAVIHSVPLDDYTGDIFDRQSDSEVAETEGAEGAETEMENEGGVASEEVNAAAEELEYMDVDPQQDHNNAQQSSSDKTPNHTEHTAANPQFPVREANQSSVVPEEDNLYPQISSAPSPTLRSTKKPAHLMPGAFNSTSQQVKDEVASQPLFVHPKPSSPAVTQEPTPPLSGADSVADIKSPPPFTPSLLRNQVYPNQTTQQVGRSEETPVYVNRSPKTSPSSRRARRSRSRTPPLLKLVDSDTEEEDGFFVSLPPTSRTKRLRKEPPRLIEGPYSTVFSDRLGRRRLSFGGRRVSGVEDQSQVSETEDGLPGEMDDMVDKKWPPQRGFSRRNQPPIRLDKGKAKAQDYNINAAAETQTQASRQRIPGQLSFKPLIGVPAQPFIWNASSSKQVKIPAQHPFSQLTEEAPNRRVGSAARRYVEQLRASSSAVPPVETEQVNHHPFSQPSQYQLASSTKTVLSNARASSSKESIFPGSAARNYAQQQFLTSRSASAAFSPSDSNKEAAPSMPNIEDHPPHDLRATSRRDGRSLPTRTSLKPSPWTTTDLATAQFRGDRKRSLRISFDKSVQDHTLWIPEHRDKDKGNGKARDDDTGGSKDRRKTFGGFFSGHVPHIDLVTKSYESRQPRPRMRHSLPTPRTVRYRSPASRSASIASTARIPNPPPPSPAAVDDQRLAMHLGTNYLLEAMSRNHGFRKEIIYELFGRLKDFKVTDTMLRHMREAAEKVAQEKLGDNEGHTAADGHNSTGSYYREDGIPLDDTRSENSQARYRGRSHSMSRPASSGLRWSPASDDAETYHPPRNSRANEYSRLVQEGRAGEARKRERRRSSYGGTSPHKKRKLKDDTTAASDGKEVDNAEQSESGPSHSLADLIANSPSKSKGEKSHFAESVKKGEFDLQLLLSGDQTALQNVEALLGKGHVRKLTAALYSMHA